MSPDAQKVHQLLTTLNDWIKIPGNRLYQQTSAGEHPTRKRTCHACGGRGTQGRRSLKPCAVCNGTMIEHVDGYTNQTPSERHQTIQAARQTRCDACNGEGAHNNGHRCHHCRGTGQRTAPPPSNPPPAPRTRYEDEAQTRHYRQGSYPELETALHHLAQTHPETHNTITRFVINGDKPTGSAPIVAYIQARITAGCQRLANTMPKPIRVPTWARHEHTATPRGRAANPHQLNQRNQHVRELHAQGLSLVKIAVEVGLTKQRVHQILNTPSGRPC